MQSDSALGSETAHVGMSMTVEDSGLWRCHTTLKKFEGDFQQVPDKITPYEIIEIEHNILVTGGVSALLHRLTGGTAVGPFDNANAAIGVGDSTTAADTAQQDLQAASNKLRKAMDANYPAHTDSASNASAKTVTFRSTFASADANWTWAEWGIFNSATAGSGRMLNRRVQALGAKVAGATYQLTVSVSIA